MDSQEEHCSQSLVAVALLICTPRLGSNVEARTGLIHFVFLEPGKVWFIGSTQQFHKWPLLIFIANRVNQVLYSSFYKSVNLDSNYLSDLPN